MLPKTQRVEKGLFPRVFSAGRSFFAPHISIRVLGGAAAASKFSFVVSKAVSKKAVDRNLLRRRGYSAVRKAGKGLSSGFVCVFNFKKGSGDISYAELSKEIYFLLEKSGVLKK